MNNDDLSGWLILNDLITWLILEKQYNHDMKEIFFLNGVLNKIEDLKEKHEV